MDRRLIIAVAVTAVIFGAVGFGGGTLLGRATARTRTFGGANGGWQALRNGQGGQDAGGGAIGKVTEKSGNSFTVKTPDGSTRTVYVSSSTQYSKTTSATLADVSVDTTVAAMGTATSGGDITASRVQIGGNMGGFGGFRGMRGNGAGGQNGGQGMPGGAPDGGGPGAGGPHPASRPSRQIHT
jgi:hypothetical protein